MTTVPCSTCKTEMIVEGKGAKDVKVWRLSYTRTDGVAMVCPYSAFCSKACSQSYLGVK